jgi:chorismate mutase
VDLPELRRELEVLDRDLVKLLFAREAIVAKIAALKAAQGIPMHDAQQEQRVLARVNAEVNARRSNSPDAITVAAAGCADAQALVRGVFEAIFQHARGRLP